MGAFAGLGFVFIGGVALPVGAGVLGAERVGGLSEGLTSGDCCGGGTRWRLNGPDDGQLVEGSVRALVRSHDGEVDASAPRVIVGFSLGGIAAVQIAQGTTGKYAGLVVVASQVHPDAAALKKAGVKRVVLAAGDLDMTSAPLQEDARILASQGVLTRFVSLGKYGHGYPPDMEEKMREPMRWVGGS